MEVQNQILSTLRGDLDKVRELVSDAGRHSRRSLSRELCRHFGFIDPKGDEQWAGCLKALVELDREGVVSLPKAKRRTQSRSSRQPEPLEPPTGVPDRVDAIQGLSVRLVGSRSELRRWSDLVAREHPFGRRPLVGRQLRYLIESDHGCLGAIGFSSSALRLEKRDAWIGWDEQQRGQHLDKVVCLSRLLIRPTVRCANLCSCVWGMVRERFSDDFEDRYGYRPWLLETFVEKDHHDGASLRASNWTYVGETKGRGRQDRRGERAQGIKDIYMCVLNPSFRDILQVSEPQVYPPLTPGEGQEPEMWAENELGGAQLGDKRLSKRLVSIAQAKALNPGVPFLQAVDGQAAAVAGYYRFVEQPAESAVTMDGIIGPHRERTLSRIQDQGTVLCIHDSTDLNYATLLACEGLGVIGKNQTGTETGGLKLHSSYVVSAAEGLPLGLLAWKCYAPELKPEHKERDARYIPIEQKEDYRWVENLAECTTRAEELGNASLIHVMDREGDFFGLFHAWRESGGGQLVVRAKHNRCIEKRPARGHGKAAKLFDTLEALPVMGTLQVQVPRKSARAKSGRKQPQPAREKRTATLELRWQRIRIQPPEHGLSAGQLPVSVWALSARETADSAGSANPLDWTLISTLPIADEQTATLILDYYAKRWRIEDWHRILKTCCRVDEPAHRDAAYLKRLIALNMVIAWRIHLMTLLGRETPQLQPQVLFSDPELKVLGLLAAQLGSAPPRNLEDAVCLVARIGGYQNRKHDLPPGAQVLWRGIKELTLITRGFLLAQGP